MSERTQEMLKTSTRGERRDGCYIFHKEEAIPCIYSLSGSRLKLDASRGLSLIPLLDNIGGNVSSTVKTLWNLPFSSSHMSFSV